MAETVSIVSRNILASGTVTVSGGTAQDAYPVERLWDWSENLIWQRVSDRAEIGPMGGDTYELGPMGGDDYEIGSSGVIVEVAQPAASILAVDTLFVAGHNLAGVELRWQYSTDGGASWHNAVSAWTPTGATAITKTLGSVVTAQHWRLQALGAVDPEAGEVIMADADSFEIARRPSPKHAWRDNVVWSRSIGGQERGVKLGDARAERLYNLRVTAAELATLQTIVSRLDGFSEPVLVKDKDGDWRIMRFDSLPTETYLTAAYTDVDVALVEML